MTQKPCASPTTRVMALTRLCITPILPGRTVSRVSSRPGRCGSTSSVISPRRARMAATNKVVSVAPVASRGSTSFYKSRTFESGCAEARFLHLRGGPMAGRVAGKVAFGTGAARGQGRSHAVRLAQEGADIIAVDICQPFDNSPAPAATTEDLLETAEMVKGLGRRIVISEVDVRDYESLKSAVDSGVEQLGGLDIIVANAG